jgi:3-oxoadipate enol-lactonase
MRDGAHLTYTHRPGSASGAPRIVLSHTLAMDRTIWAPLLAALPEFEILTYDVRGHGESTKAPGPYAPSTFADDLAELLRGVGWHRAIVVGASMGGSISLQFAIEHPAMVAALGLVDTTAWYGTDAPSAWRDRAKKAEADGFAALIGFQQTRWFSDGFRAAHPEIVQRTNDIFVRNDVASYVATCDYLGAFDARATLAAIVAPTEVLVGADDYATPVDMAEELERSIPGAHLTIVPDVRHLTILEVPDRVADLVRTLDARAKGRTVANQR